MSQYILYYVEGTWYTTLFVVSCGFEMNPPIIYIKSLWGISQPARTNIFLHNKYNFNPIMSEIITILIFSDFVNNNYNLLIKN